MYGALNNFERSSPNLRQPQPTLRAWPAPTLLAAIAILLAGCANPGPPKPPSLHLPKPATALTAQRIGDRVQINWTVSTDTTDGGTLRLPITAAICRDTSPTPASACDSIQRLNVVPGPAHAIDLLPPTLASGKPTLLTYRIELLNARNRSAGVSLPTYTVAGAAPAPMGPLATVPRRNAALITWQPLQPPVPVELRRTLLATAAGPVAPPDHRKSNQFPAASPMGTSSRTTTRELTLTPEKTSSDPGGTLDRTLHDGDVVTYTAQRVLTVRLPTPASTTSTKDGKSKEVKASTVTLELRGEPSPLVTFAFHDTVPPSSPTGLAAIPGGGFGEPPSIDLSWEPNPESDLLGYNIYRADAGSNPNFIRLNPEPIPGPGFRDLTAKPAQPYLYRVTAVDQRHNESAPTQPLPEHLHP